MITTTIAVAALIGASVGGFYAIKFKNQYLDIQAKYDAIKDFANDAGKNILKLEEANAQLATQVVQQQATIQEKDATISSLKQEILLVSSVPQGAATSKKPRKK